MTVNDIFVKKLDINQFNIIFYFIVVTLFTRCANIVPLTGGKKDYTPPKLISTFPANYSKNFNERKIILNFNEKVQLLNPYQNIIITPILSKPLEWKVKSKSIEIFLPSVELQLNTTYKIIFNRTIADLTEKNTIDNIEYVFSTGSYIDSFYIKGNVKNAFTLNNEKSVLVGLYDKDKNDSIVMKEKPIYFTRTDEEGNYSLKNLPHKDFRIIAFSDLNNNFQYEPIKEKIGFFEYTINPSKDSILNLFVAEEKPMKNYLKKLYLMNSYQIILIYSFPDKYQLISSSENVRVINDSLYSDTCKIFVHDIDTAHVIIKNSTQLDTLNIPINNKLKTSPIYQLKGQVNNQQVFFSPVLIQSNFWIDTIDVKSNTLFYYEKDSLNPIDKKHIKVYPHQIIIDYPFKEKSSYTLKVPVKSINSKDSVSYQKFELKISSIENFAQLKVNILFPEKREYIVALCNLQHKIVYSTNINLPISASNKQIVEFKNVIPDTYILKIIQDDNQNKQWDTHQFILTNHKKQQAEKVFVYPKPVKLINNWDVILDWKEVK